MTDDPLRHFAEQQISFELLEHCRETLLADAREVLREDPAAEIVGTIFEAAARECEPFRAAIEQATGMDLTGRGFQGVAPRQFVLDLLGRTGPAAEWLPSSTIEGRRMLPVVAATRHGLRFAAFPLDE